MTSVASGLAEYLQAPAYWAQGVDAVAKARWGERGVDGSLLSPVDAKADADAELARQLAFMKEPHAAERVQVAPVDLDGLRGQCVTVRAAAPGYGDGGALVFVLGGTVDDATGVMTLDVLRRLAS